MRAISLHIESPSYYSLGLVYHERAAEEVRCVFDDNSKIIFVKSS